MTWSVTGYPSGRKIIHSTKMIGCHEVNKEVMFKVNCELCYIIMDFVHNSDGYVFVVNARSPLY